MKEIFSIEKGCGQGSTFYTTSSDYIGNSMYVHCIKEEWKNVGPGSILVYRGYEDPGMKLIFEIEAGSQLTLIYK